MGESDTDDLFDLAEARISGSLPIEGHHPLQVGGPTRTAAGNRLPPAVLAVWLPCPLSSSGLLPLPK